MAVLDDDDEVLRHVAGERVVVSILDNGSLMVASFSCRGCGLMCRL